MFSPFVGFEKGIQKQGPGLPGLPGLCGVWFAAREVFEFKLQRDLPFDDWDFSHLGADSCSSSFNGKNGFLVDTIVFGIFFR
jgi:hypothetical protein